MGFWYKAVNLRPRVPGTRPGAEYDFPSEITEARYKEKVRREYAASPEVSRKHNVSCQHDRSKMDANVLVLHDR
jgi:hypothetical protein